MTKLSPQVPALPNDHEGSPGADDRRRPIRPLRLLVALLGGYAFTWGFTTLGVTGLVVLGVDFHEAETALLLLAFLVFLPLFLWAFAACNLARVWAVLGGGAVFMTAAGGWLQRALLS